MTPDTLAQYRQRYPAHLLVFRTAPDANIVYLPHSDRPWTATVDEADEAILEAVKGGLRVLVVAWGLQRDTIEKQVKQ